MTIASGHERVCTRRTCKQTSRLALRLAVALFVFLSCSQLVSAKTYALVVGIGTYESRIPTKIRADIDAREMALAFKRAGIEDVDTLINKDATQNAILNWFDVAEMRVRAGDMVFLYFAGHGGLVPDITGREAESAAFFPYDADGSGGVATDHAITDEELGNLVITSLRNCNVVVFIDACHSGGLMREGTDSPLVSRGEGVARGLLTAVRERKDNGRTLFLSSSREFEQSWEYPGQTPAGIFTSFLVEAMTCADTDRNGEITFGELATYVSKGVEEFVIKQEGAYQRPVNGASPEEAGSYAFPLFNTPSECKVVQRIDRSTSIATSLAAETIDIPDHALESAIRARLHGYTGLITKDLAESVTTLEAPSSEIRSLEGLQSFSNLERLDLRNNQIADLAPLKQMSLRTVKLSNNLLTSLDALSGSVDMRYLSAERNNLQDITALSKMRQLAWLLLSHNSISDLRPLSGLTKLMWLELLDNEVVDISPLSELTNLTQLDLRNNRIVDISPISALANLEGLDLSGNRITDISPLSGLTNLENLDLGDNRIADINPLSKLTNLTQLDLWNNRTADISPLADLVKLVGLNAGKNQIADISPLSGLTNLQSLVMSGNPVRDISALRTLVAIQSLDLDSAGISDISALAQMTDLRSLSLAGNEISDIGPIGGMTGMAQLFLENNRITDIGPLLALDNLKELELNGNPLHGSVSGTVVLDPPNSEPLYPGVTYNLQVHVTMSVSDAPIYEVMSFVTGRDCWTSACSTPVFAQVLKPGTHSFDVATRYKVPCDSKPGWIIWYNFGVEFAPHNGWVVAALPPLEPAFGYSPIAPTAFAPVQFLDQTSTPGEVASREWSVDGVVLGEGPAFTYSFPEAGTYEITLAVTRACGGQPVTVTRSIDVAP